MQNSARAEASNGAVVINCDRIKKFWDFILLFNVPSLQSLETPRNSATHLFPNSLEFIKSRGRFKLVIV